MQILFTYTYFKVLYIIQAFFFRGSHDFRRHQREIRSITADQDNKCDFEQEFHANMTENKLLGVFFFSFIYGFQHINIRFHLHILIFPTAPHSSIIITIITIIIIIIRTLYNRSNSCRRTEWTVSSHRTN
jgi:hypothetical protein